MVEESSSAGAGTPVAEGASDAPEILASPDAKDPPPGEIPSCCVATIQQHVRFNPMMVCGDCKNIIKCFLDERAYENYLKFCRSRRRPVLTGRVEEYMTVAFRPYDTYSR